MELGKQSPQGERSNVTPLRLCMRGISKRFGATKALTEVHLDAHRSRVLALIGENGAGKSTLMKILGGAHPPDEGSMQIEGCDFRPVGPQSARTAGISIVYQELNLADELSVEDNIMLGVELSRGGFVQRRKQRRRVAEALELLGHPGLSPTRLVGSLSIGAKQLVEIARALVSDARVVVFDEPTSSLAKHDVERLFRIIERLKERGIAIIYISHFLEEIREVADDYLILRDGTPVGSGRLQDVSDQQIVSLMVGRSVETLFPQVPHQLGEPILRVDRVSGQPMPREVSFELRRGEILGLFGLIGAGRTETMRQLFGLDPSVGGIVEVGGKPITGGTGQRIKTGLGLVSEDRKAEGLAQPLSIADNLTLSRLSPYTRWGLLNLSNRRKRCDEWLRKLQVKAQGPEQPIRSLSGGNQQKVAIARVLHQDAEVLLLDEPTRGIDVNTKAEIYRLIGELAATGKAIIFVSSYLPELLAVCDTLGVMARGELRAIKPVEQWTETDVLAAAVAP